MPQDLPIVTLAQSQRVVTQLFTPRRSAGAIVVATLEARSQVTMAPDLSVVAHAEVPGHGKRVAVWDGAGPQSSISSHAWASPKPV